MLVTPDEDVAAWLRRLREHGMDLSAAARHASAQPVIEHYTEVGFNYRMTDIQAAIGLVQLGKLGQLVAPAARWRSGTSKCSTRYRASGPSPTPDSVVSQITAPDETKPVLAPRTGACMTPDTRPGLDPRRLIRLMSTAIDRCSLDLSGLTVLTEAASGAYVVTPVLAAMAGADVYALAAGTAHASSEEIQKLTVELPG